MKTILFLGLTLFSISALHATHLLGGYIQTKSVAGSALTYEITAVVYMNTNTEATSQLTSLTICFGDGSSAVANRVGQEVITLNTRGLYSSVTASSYRTTHSYIGPGTYVLTTSAANRTTSINTAKSDTQEPITLKTTLLTTSASNQTPSLPIPSQELYIPINQRATFSVKATDIDGDSLLYELAKPNTSDATSPCNYRQVSGYQFPNDLTHQGTFKLANRTGELTWDTPTQGGYFSLAIIVSEYRNGILISQTTQEITLLVLDLPGTPSPIPVYEPAIEGNGSIVTAIVGYSDPGITFVTFPNPVEDRLQVVIQTSNPATAKIELMDINGRKIHELAFNRTMRQHEQVIDMDSLTPGIYLVRANINGRSLLRKVVKK